jgi:hypothetical protein
MYKYLYNVGIGLSVTLNAILAGQPYQTFSARNYVWYLKDKRNLVWLIDTMLGKDHCWECFLNWKYGYVGKQSKTILD